MEQKIYNVTELNEYVKALVESDGVLSGLYVRGELSIYKVYPSGHHYHHEGRKRRAALRHVSRQRLEDALPAGQRMKVARSAASASFRATGVSALCERPDADGVGDLYFAFEQLKEKHLKEGLFDPKYKKPIPRFPDRIAVITSGAGAAVRDIIRVRGKRWPRSKVIVLPVRVQGAEAPPEIAGALRYANRHKIADLIITGRGGGSIEDLWAFNDERVAREIFKSARPVISAVGPEPDVTISDFVADLRAATPSNAPSLPCRTSPKCVKR
jgi:exodeoxyribonuclease VII large subunit